MVTTSEFLEWQLKYLKEVMNSLAYASNESGGKAKRHLMAAMSEIHVAVRQIEQAQEVIQGGSHGNDL